MDLYFTPEELAEWEPLSLHVESWFAEGDEAEFCAEKLDSRLYVLLMRARDGTPLCTQISETVINRALEEEQVSETSFRVPVRLEQALPQESSVIHDIEELLGNWLQVVTELAHEVGPAAWTAPTGRRLLNRPYVALAVLFVFLQNNGSGRATDVCAYLMATKYETAKSRIRYARQRGILSNPGKGSSQPSKLTQLGQQLEKEFFGHEYS